MNKEMKERLSKAPFVTQQIRDDVQSLLTDDSLLRKLLWLNHGCGFSGIYGDDGEM